MNPCLLSLILGVIEGPTEPWPLIPAARLRKSPARTV